MTIAAVMQPYFFPYAGYFQLLAAADIFVIYDCVQFPRRGFVHRCHVPGPSGAIEWLTLPLARQPQETLIRDLAFAAGARAGLDRRLARLPWFERAEGAAAEALRSHLRAPLGQPVDFLEQGLRLAAAQLELDARLVRRSTLAIDPGLRGEDRIMAIVRAVGASHYVNAPGGRALYDPQHFRNAGLSLSFLPPYSGPYRTMLHDLMTTAPAMIARSLRDTALLLPA